MSDFYEKNIELILKRFNISIDNKKIDNENYVVENSKDNKHVLKIKKNNKWVYLGSKYNQLREVEKFIHQIEFNDEIVYYIIVGFNFGYHIRELLKQIQNSYVLVLETDIEVLKCACYYEDLSDMFENNKLEIAIFNSDADLNEILFKYVYKKVFSSIYYNVYSNYKNIYEEKTQIITKRIEKFYNILNMDFATSKYWGNTLLENFTKNLDYMRKGVNLSDFYGVFKNKPVVIVSSGPSLSKNIKFLKQYEDRAIIVTGGRNLEAIFKENIKPHFACAVDPGKIMYKLMENVINTDIPFILSDSINYDVFEYSNSNNNIVWSASFPRTIKKLFGRQYVELPRGGSVAHICIASAVFMGCNPVIIIGQDSAFTDNKIHADVSSFNHLEVNDSEFIQDKFYVEDNYGGKILTDAKLNAYKIWIEDFINANPQTTFINCTEGGAKIHGAKFAKLENTLKFLPSININTYDKIKQIMNNCMKTPKYKVEFEVNKLKQKLKNIQNLDNLFDIQEYLNKNEEVYELMYNILIVYLIESLGSDNFVDLCKNLAQKIYELI